MDEGLTPVMIGDDLYRKEDYPNMDAVDECLPAGKYLAALTKIETKVSQKNLKYLNMQFTVIDDGGLFNNRKVYHSLMIDKGYDEVTKNRTAKFIDMFKAATGMGDYWEEAFHIAVFIHTKIEVGNDNVKRARITKVERAE